MNCGTRLGLTVLSMCAYGFAQKKDPEMAKIFAASQYVFVETIYGPLETTTLDSRVSPEDRRAVFNVEDAVRSWGRYRLTLNRSDAELVFVVRKGQLLAANIGMKISGVPNPRGGPSQRGTSGEPAPKSALRTISSLCMPRIRMARSAALFGTALSIMAWMRPVSRCSRSSRTKSKHHPRRKQRKRRSSSTLRFQKWQDATPRFCRYFWWYSSAG